MAGVAGTIETAALELGQALKPLAGLLKPDIFIRLGFPLPVSITGDAAILARLQESADLADAMVPHIDSLQEAVTAGNVISIAAEGVSLISSITQLISKLEQLGTAVSNASASLPPGPDKTNLQALATHLAVRILEYATVGYMDMKLPALTSTLTLLGIIDKEVKVPPIIETATTLLPIVPRRFHLDYITQLLSHPTDYFKKVYGLGTAEFTGKELLEKIQALLVGFGIPAELYKVGNGPLTLEAYLFKITVTPPGYTCEINIPGAKTFDQSYPLSGLWNATVHVEAAFAAGLKVLLNPPLNFTVKPPTGTATLNTLLGIKAQKATNEPIIILGLTGGTQLQAKSIAGSVGFNVSATTAGANVVPSFNLTIDEGKLIIDFSQGDGFIQKLLSGVHAEADFGLAASWNPNDGLRLQGSGGVEVLIPLHIDLSVVSINGLYFKLAVGTDAQLQIGLGLQMATTLGPLKAVIDGIGTNIPISFPANGKGNLGLADIDFEFAPPKDIGLSVDTGPIKGGGFLSIDVAKGEYVGVMELSFQGFIDLKAIGIINTKMPDGSKGFSLLILITAEFTPIQLGFGFTLNGVGGLLAVNRTTDVNALREGVKTGAISSILFPQDIVANITRIISDLKSIFPISDGHFIIAPMAKIGWGTPTLISLELGIIIDIPTPQLIILGVLRCVLPTEEAAILKLQVNFAGGINFDKGLIWFDASLFDSRLLVFTLTGDMALRICWGDNPMFIISVGGFHPSYTEIPDDLKNMKRLMIALLSGDNPRLTVATYFAVTSNTVQSGARVELYAEACGLNVFGYLGYDLLVQFSPFHFIADIEAGLALRNGTSEIAGIHVFCELSGPTPWHAIGKASLKILFFKISVHFNITWGEDPPAQPDELTDVLKLVADALGDDRNWKASFPANSNTNVSLRKVELAPEKIIIHPYTTLSVNQKVVPLEMQINKFGNKKPAADTIFHLTNSEPGTSVFLTEEFALGNFVKLSDDQKLVRKSFEQMKSGLTFKTTNAITHGFEIRKEVSYELSYVHRKKDLVIHGGYHRITDTAFNVLLNGNAINKNMYAVGKRVPTNPPATVTVGGGHFTVVNVMDLQPYAANTVAISEAEAYAMHDDLVRNNPSLKNKIQVLSQFELN